MLRIEISAVYKVTMRVPAADRGDTLEPGASHRRRRDIRAAAMPRSGPEIHAILTAPADTGSTRYRKPGLNQAGRRLTPCSSNSCRCLQVAGQTMLKIVPITIGMGVVFAVLTHWSACNPGRPWWQKREIVTDVCYWFLIPLMARFVRIGLMVMGAAMLFDIHGADALIKFYDNGFGPLGELPLWAQALTFLVASDFLLYWFHRLYHGAHLWKYHAVHHSSEELDWISAARFHPVNILFGTVIVDVALLLAGISPNVMLWVGPFTTAIVRLRPCQSELDAGAVQIRDRRPGVPSLASHRGRSRRLEQFRRHVPDLGPPVRHLLHAGERAAGRLWYRRQALSRKASARQLIYPFLR